MARTGRGGSSPLQRMRGRPRAPFLVGRVSSGTMRRFVTLALALGLTALVAAAWSTRCAAGRRASQSGRTAPDSEASPGVEIDVDLVEATPPGSRIGPASPTGSGGTEFAARSISVPPTAPTGGRARCEPSTYPSSISVTGRSTPYCRFTVSAEGDGAARREAIWSPSASPRRPADGRGRSWSSTSRRGRLRLLGRPAAFRPDGTLARAPKSVVAWSGSRATGVAISRPLSSERRDWPLLPAHRPPAARPHASSPEWPPLRVGRRRWVGRSRLSSSCRTGRASWLAPFEARPAARLRERARVTQQDGAARRPDRRLRRPHARRVPRGLRSRRTPGARASIQPEPSSGRRTASGWPTRPLTTFSWSAPPTGRRGSACPSRRRASPGASGTGSFRLPASVMYDRRAGPRRTRNRHRRRRRRRLRGLPRRPAPRAARGDEERRGRLGLGLRDRGRRRPRARRRRRGFAGDLRPSHDGARYAARERSRLPRERLARAYARRARPIPLACCEYSSRMECDPVEVPLDEIFSLCLRAEEGMRSPEAKTTEATSGRGASSASSARRGRGATQRSWSAAAGSTRSRFR